jgi:hypothetical protein
LFDPRVRINSSIVMKPSFSGRGTERLGQRSVDVRSVETDRGSHKLADLKHKGYL